MITKTNESLNAELYENSGLVKEEDVETGWVYVLQSKSNKDEIRSIQNLYKIGYSKTPVEERVKNAEHEPTYLMAKVGVVRAYKCYNLNPQKFEQLLHNFFGATCLNIDVFDGNGNRYTPREWFIAPFEIIEEAINLIISGDVIKYRYDAVKEDIVLK